MCLASLSCESREQWGNDAFVVRMREHSDDRSPGLRGEWDAGDGKKNGEKAHVSRVMIARAFAMRFYWFNRAPPLQMPKTKDLTAKQRDGLLSTLRARFEANMNRHANLAWSAVQARFASNSAKLRSLDEMEESGGEPDVVGLDSATGEFIFVDCSAQSPKGRRSVCYDRAALEARKEHKPKTSAIDMATAMGASLLTVAEYKQLQEVGEFDTTTSSWVETPAEIRKLGGALFCDRRYDTVFVYHNGAESYYAARGFRCSLRV
jgi:hypothetical protein